MNLLDPEKLGPLSRAGSVPGRGFGWTGSLLSVLAAALLCSAPPASGQELPAGEGKELVAAQWNSCHPF